MLYNAVLEATNRGNKMAKDNIKNRGRNFLLSPGPAEVPPETLLEMAGPLFHHRTGKFRKILGETVEKLKQVLQTKEDTVLLTSSGTGAMEAAVCNLLERGDKAVVVRGGKFGERFGELCETYGIEFVPIDVEWGEVVSVSDIESALKSNRDAKAVFTTLVETSTGVAPDIKAIAGIVGKTDALLVVDGISGVGGQELRMDSWGVDVVVTGSQKALMLPPGLAFVAMSERAWDRVASVKTPRYYFDLRKARKKIADSDTPFTPALTLVIGLNKSLDRILGEGIEAVWARHKKLARATRAGVEAMGLEVFAKAPSDVVTSVRLPDSIDGNAVPQIMRDEYGVTIAGGQEALKGKICRIAHMGWMDLFDVLVALSALEIVLNRLGFPIEAGKGPGAAEKVFMEQS